MTPEIKVQNKIVSFLKSQVDAGEPLEYEKRQAGGFSYKKGKADIWFVYYGLHAEVELKRLGGSMEPMQETWQRIYEHDHIPHACIDNYDAFLEFYEMVKEKASALR